MCSRFSPVPAVTQFEAQVVIMELLDHKPILTGGYKAVLHIHSGAPCPGWCRKENKWAGWGVREGWRARCGSPAVGDPPGGSVLLPVARSPYPFLLALLRPAVVEECEVTKLVAVIDPKTKEKKKAKFAKSGAMCVARIAVEKPICIETFDHVPQVWAGIRQLPGTKGLASPACTAPNEAGQRRRPGCCQAAPSRGAVQALMPAEYAAACCSWGASRCATRARQ